MRPPFTDYRRLQDEAKKAISEGTSYIRRWWSQKYNRPHNDPLFSARPLAVWAREMFEDVYEQKRDVELQIEDPDTTPTERTRLTAKLRRLNRALDETVVSDDPLADKWERELAQGIIPDLDEQL